MERKNETLNAQKLLQYAERVWNITDGSDDERIDAAIAATRRFFEQRLGVSPVRPITVWMAALFRRYWLNLRRMDAINLGENQDITLDVSRRILLEVAR